MIDRKELLPGIDLHVFDDSAVVTSEVPLTVLSSAVQGGGMVHGVRTLLNKTVGKNFCCDHPADVIDQEVVKRNWSQPTVGLLTAVHARHGAFSLSEIGSAKVACVVTAGVSNAYRAGEVPEWLSEAYSPGTINVIVIVDGQLPESAFVNAVMTVTEVKTSLLHERGIRCQQSGKPATGTTTDAVVIACTGQGTFHPYAGPGTPVGTAIARAVSTAMIESLDRWHTYQASHE